MAAAFADRPEADPPPEMNRARRVWTQCGTCSLWFAALSWRVDRGDRLFCSTSCANKWRSGERNPRWLGGVSRDNMRYRRRQQERWPHKERARKALRYAVRRGYISRGDCERCGVPNAQGHHPDYSMPLDVVWLCRTCHDEEHAAAG